MKRIPRLVNSLSIGGATEPIEKKPIGSFVRRSVWTGKPMKRKDFVYEIIEKACCHGYCFTDRELGFPWIEYRDLEEQEDGIYIIRFRCPVEYMHPIFFERMAESVCKELRSGMHFCHETKMECGLPFEDCVWVIQEGELDPKIDGETAPH